MIAAKSIKEIHRFESSDTKSISSIFEEINDQSNMMVTT